MNYILEQKIGWRDVVEHNTTTREIVKLFDDRYNTVTKIPDGENYLYLKVPYDDMQFVVFHNISASKVKVKVFDNSGNLLEEKEKETERLISRPIINGGEMIKSFYDINIYLEMTAIQNSGFMEIYIYPLNGTGYIGRIDYGIPEFLGCLNWNFSQSAKAVSIPKQLTGGRDSGETNLLSWDSTYNVTYTVFKDAANNDDPSAAYLRSKLSGLFSAKYRRLEFANIDGTNNYLNDWIMKKVTFIDPFATKQVGLFSLDSYSFNGKNSVVSEARVALRGWVDNRDSIKFEDDWKQEYILSCKNADASDNCLDNLPEDCEGTIINPIHLKDFPASGTIFYYGNIGGAEQFYSKFYFESLITGELFVRIESFTPYKGDLDGRIGNGTFGYFGNIRVGGYCNDDKYYTSGDNLKFLEFSIDILEDKKFYFWGYFVTHGAKYKIYFETREIDYGQNKNYKAIDKYDFEYFKTFGLDYQNFDETDGIDKHCLIATADNAYIEIPYKIIKETKQITPIFEIGIIDGIEHINDFHVYLFGEELTINRTEIKNDRTKIFYNTIDVSNNETTIRIEADKKDMTVCRLYFIEWGEK